MVCFFEKLKGIRSAQALLMLLLFTATSAAQDKTFTLTPFVNVISSARIYTSPFASDPSGRNPSTDLSAFLSGRLSWSWSYSNSGRIQVNAEYMESDQTREDNNGTVFGEGLRMGALELCVQYVLPFSGNRLRLFMGGGGGMYAGVRMHSIAGVESTRELSSLSAGILAVFGAEYFLSGALSVVAEIRYRDPQIETRNAFPIPSVVSNGITYPLDQRPFASRVNIDGNVYSLGLSVHF